MIGRRPEKQFVDAPRLHDFGVAKPHALHADFVDRSVARRMAVCNHVRQNVLHQFGASPNHRAVAHSAELMHRGEPADDHAVADDAVTAKRGIVAENAVIAHMTLMADMRVGTKEIV